MLMSVRGNRHMRRTTAVKRSRKLFARCNHGSEEHGVLCSTLPFENVSCALATVIVPTTLERQNSQQTRSTRITGRRARVFSRGLPCALRCFP